MKRFAVVIAATALVLPGLAAGVASNPTECPVCDCSNDISYFGRSAPSPVAIPVPEIHYDDYPADDGYATGFDDYNNYGYQPDLDMDYGL